MTKVPRQAPGTSSSPVDPLLVIISETTRRLIDAQHQLTKAVLDGAGQHAAGREEMPKNGEDALPSQREPAGGYDREDTGQLADEHDGGDDNDDKVVDEAIGEADEAKDEAMVSNPIVETTWRLIDAQQQLTKGFLGGAGRHAAGRGRDADERR